MQIFKALARSELLSTFFPTWLWQGRQWSKLRVPRHDPYYWFNAHSHPVLSTYYPPHAITSIIGSKLSLDRAFNLLVICMLLHFAYCGIGWFIVFKVLGVSMLAGLFGALTMTFQGAHLRQQPCIIYTLSWFPWMLYGLLTHNILISSVSIGMMLLSGYYPIAVFLLPVSLIFGQWLPIGIGLLIGSVQLVPFLKYLPKTIRGVVEAPSDSPVENKFYFGIIPIFILLVKFKMVYLTLAVPFLFRLFKSTLFRVPQRATILACYGAIYFSVIAINSLSNLQVLLLILVQCIDLWIHNKELVPPRPFVELWEKPSRAFNTKLTRFLKSNLREGRVSGLPYPLFTGHINSLKTIGYCGSMQSKEMWSWRKSFKHNPFIDGVNESDLTRHNVRFAYSRKRLDWPGTGIRNLYRNPAHSC